MCCELGWDDSLHSAEHANRSSAGIRNRDSPQRLVLVGIYRKLTSDFLASANGGLKFPDLWTVLSCPPHQSAALTNG